MVQVAILQVPGCGWSEYHFLSSFSQVRLPSEKRHNDGQPAATQGRSRAIVAKV